MHLSELNLYLISAYYFFITSFISHATVAQEMANEQAHAGSSETTVESSLQTGAQFSHKVLTKEELVAKYTLPESTPGIPMTLSDALSLANQRNLSLQALRTEIDNAQAQLKTAMGMALPSITGKVNYIVHDHEDSVNLYAPLANFPNMPPELAGAPSTTVMPKQDLNGVLEAFMPLVNLQAWYNIKVSKSAINLAGLNVEAVRQQLLLNVAEAYFSALMAHKLIEMQMSTIASFDHHLTVSEANLKAGNGLRIDVIRAQADIDTAKQLLISAHLAYDNARDALRVLTGASKLPEPVVIELVDIPRGSENELVQKGLSRKSELKFTMALKHLKQEQLHAAQMQLLPSIGLLWNGTYQISEPSDLGSSDKSRMFVLLSLSVPIFNYYRYGDIQARRVDVKKTSILHDDAVEQNAMKVRKARRDFLAALASVEIAERQSALSEEALALTEAAFASGTGTSLDVTDARRNSLQSAVATATQSLQVQMSLLKLLYEIGEDMSNLGQNSHRQ